MNQFGWDACPDATRAQVMRLVHGFRTIAGDGGLDAAAATALADYLRSRIAPRLPVRQ